MDTFFPDEAAYKAWIAGLPGIFSCNDDTSGHRLICFTA